MITYRYTTNDVDNERTALTPNISEDEVARTARRYDFQVIYYLFLYSNCIYIIG
jgi:hypothetical protein